MSQPSLQDEIRAHHRSSGIYWIQVKGRTTRACDVCRNPMPCDAIRAAEELDKRDALLKALEPAILLAISATWKPEDYTEFREIVRAAQEGKE